MSASRAARGPRAARAPAGIVQIVVTPGSGEGRAQAIARRLAMRLKRRGHGVDVRSFTDLAALARWAETCPPGSSHMVCIGGDATLSAAAAAAIRCDTPGSCRCPTASAMCSPGLRPFGQAGAVARLLEEGEVRTVDVGRSSAGGEEFFLSHRSYGFLEHTRRWPRRGRQQPRPRVRRLL